MGRWGLWSFSPCTCFPRPEQLAALRFQTVGLDGSVNGPVRTPFITPSSAAAAGPRVGLAAQRTLPQK